MQPIRPDTSNTSAPIDSLVAAATPAAVGAPAELHSHSLMADPYPVYRKLLAEKTMTRSTLGFWVAAHYEDVSFILRDKRFGHDYESGMIARHGPEVFKEPAPRAIRHWLILQNPPKHSRIRALFADAFSVHRIKRQAPGIERIANALVDKVIDRGRMDAVSEFAFPLPAIVISEILGLPPEDHAQFMTRIPSRVLDMAPLTREESERANADVEFITSYFQELCAERRRSPRDDLITALVQGQEQNGLSEEELISNIFLLFAAGHDTTTHFIGNALLALQRNPDQFAKLKSDPGLIPNAVDELVRYDSSVQMTIRHALADIDISGASIKRGNPVMVLIGAANRDPKVYPDPDRLDVTRSDLRVLSFGAGLHYCLGAELARLECAIALRTLLRRLPNLAIDTENIAWRKTLTLRGLSRLEASW